MGAGGILSCGTQYIDQVVIAVMECCFFGKQVNPVECDLPLPYLALFSRMTGDAVVRDSHLRIECGAEPLALVVIGKAIEQALLYAVETLDRVRRAIDRIHALLAIVGIGRLEQRLLLGGDEAVQFAFDAGVVGDLFLAGDPGIDRRRGWGNRNAREVEVCHAPKLGASAGFTDYGRYWS